jgi:hypothetical protein
MSGAPMGHLEDEQLLRYADGESPAGVASAIRSHLEACWQCREQLEELQRTVGECVRYRKNVLQRHLPPPPSPWTDIFRGFGEIDAALAEDSFGERLARILRGPMLGARRWATAAVALLIVCALFYRFRQTPSVQAAELLRRAIAAADARPGKSRRIEIRTRDSRVTRATGAGAEAQGSLRSLFLAAHYDWDDPLSARSYQAWRDSLADRQEEVVEERDAFRIRTHTRSGELMQATLKIRRQDLRPVEERFEFRNREWVEIAELGEEAAPVEPIAVAGGAATVNGAREPLPARPAPATIGDELHVLAALHAAGADLGDPIEVSRTGGDVLVAGVGIAPERQREIHNALGSQKHVVVHFSEPALSTLEPETEAPAESSASADIQRLQARMAEQVGGRAYFTQLATQVLDLSEPMMARAHALRRLAERIPIDLDAELSAPDRRLLRSLQREHVEALRRQAAEIDRLLMFPLESLSGATRTPPDSMTFAGAWQPATEQLFQSARRVDKLLAVMFGAAAGESSAERLPSQLLSSLSQLRARLEAFDRLSAQSAGTER